ncbi:dienelactone hydrolase family protein [Oricola sp.]|uniref:dienelactone hydrolase family protein n=1 Tax=Oricola sp. TaxID=1979950 RepID=UPI0025EE1263|nr:dienelactone hydrolase family protein [Oricola sp.]MCI5075189.1 dienelactone hydrolase family protein [Oricola sp.]
MILASAALLAATPALAENVSYELNGETLNGYFAAASEPKGLVLIVHDWDGMTDYERQRADMLAEMGFNAFALDMFGDTPAETVEQRQAATGALYGDRDRMRALIDAGVAKAREMAPDGGLVVAGYCFGGAVALEMARSEKTSEAAGYATFHGGLATPEGQGWSSEVPPLLIMHGGADTAIPMSDVATLTGELEEAGATYTIEVYSKAPHAFTVFGSNRYEERADRESWEAFSEFLTERLEG